MKKTIAKLLVAGLLFTACNNEPSKTDETKTGATVIKEDIKSTESAPPPGPPDSAQMAAMQKAWMDFATPGDMHKWLAKSEGTWVSDSVAQWMDPAAPPSYSKATSIDKVVLGGLYLQGDYSSNMMGQPMAGKTLIGFDKMKKKFVMSWIDNMGSGIVRLEGEYDEATKTLNMKGKQSDPGSAKETDIRQEQKWIDDNTYKLTMYGTGHDGKTEQKFMEGTFKRKK